MHISIPTLLAIISSISFAAADCCNAMCIVGVGCICPDNTQPTPCCGIGPCNFLCCACDGGCRQGPGVSAVKTPMSISASASGSCIDDTFTLVDRDGSGNITLAEYLSYANWTQDGKIVSGGAAEAMYIKHFKEFDSDKNGVIDRKEAQ